MVSVSDDLTIENAGSYYKAHYSALGEYYAPTDNPTIAQAVGKGAEALGLAGPVTAEQFEALLRGIDPNSGAVLRTGPSRSDATARAGFDMTFSPPKSISIQALVAGDIRLIDAARDAALRALQEAERCALARQHGGSEWVQTSNICAVVFEHYDARESVTGEHGPMPQLHHHSFVTNLTRRPDGRWRGLDAEQIYKARLRRCGLYGRARPQCPAAWLSNHPQPQEQLRTGRLQPRTGRSILRALPGHRTAQSGKGHH